MPAKNLLIGLDAMDGHLMRRWAESGEMPNIAALMQGAQWAEVSNPVGFNASVSIWPSFYTASGPAQHGRYAYRQYVPETYGTRETSPEELLCPPFWQVFSDQGKRLAILDMPSGPLSKGLNGVQVAYWGPHDIEGEFATWPEELAPRIVENYGSDEVGQCDHCGRGPGDLERFGQQLLRRIDGRKRFSLDLLASDNWDLFCTVFNESHCVGHQAWHLHDTAHPEHSGGEDLLAQVYSAIDSAIGELVAQAGEDARVMVYSSQGMGPSYSGDHLVTKILARREPGSGKPSAGGRLYQALYKLRSRIPPVMHESFGALKNRLRNRLLSGDWASRDCFPLPPSVNAVSCMRLNIVGRDPRGRLQPGEALEAYCQALSRDLQELVNPDTGNPVVRHVTRVAEEHGECAGFPDLLIHWNNNEPINAVYSERLGRIEGNPPSSRTGDHTANGFVVATNPAPGPLGRSVQCSELVPTLGRWLGADISGFHGQPVGEWV